MRFALMIASVFIIATVAVAMLEPLAPQLPTAPADAAPQEQAADAGDGETVDREDYSGRPTAKPGHFDEAAQDVGK